MRRAAGRLKEWAARLRGTFGGGRDDDDLAEELRAHMAFAAEDARRARGPDAAPARAVPTLGGVQAMDRLRDQREIPWLADALADVRYALRSLRKHPGFTLVAIATLALGLGANTAAFSVVHAVLLRPLPYPDSASLVRVYETVPGAEIGNGKGPSRRYGAMDVADVLAASGRARTLAFLATSGLAMPKVTVDGAATRLEGFRVSVSFLPMVGVQPLAGRTFTPEEGTEGREHVLVLGYDAWRQFGGSPQILGSTVTLTVDPGNPFDGSIGVNVPYTVVGVMPPGFRFPRDNAQFWIPRVLTPPAGGRPLRLEAIARLAPGATVESAAAELETLQRERRGTPAAAPVAPRFELVRLQDEITRPIRPALIVLTVAVAVILLIACVNMANLLLARGEARHREIVVRAAVGASRGRLVRQLLTESLLLSALGGMAGTLLACAGVRLFRTLGTTLGRTDLGAAPVVPGLAEITIDGTALVYALALAVCTGVLFGLAPALQCSRTVHGNVLREAASSPRTRLRNVLVIGEIALVMVLLVAAGLLINSFAALATVDVGFDPSNVLTFQVTASAPQDADRKRDFAEALVDRLRSAPGVESAGYARQLPFVDLADAITLTMRRHGVEVVLGEAPDIRLVSRDYLPAIGARILAGRNFTEADGAGRPGVVIVNEAFVRREFAGENPVGQFVFFGPQRQMPLEIIGVVSDIRQFGPDRAPEPQYFMDIRQIPTDPAFRAPPLFPVGAYYAVRSPSERAALVSEIRTIVRQLDPHATLDNVATMEQILANSLTRPWMYAVLLGLLAAVGLSLACIGLYGVMTYVVAQRTREIGIRMALGAGRRGVLTLVLRQSIALIVVGLALGLAGALAASRTLTGLLFGITPLDPATYAVAVGVFLVVAAAASYVPARHATRVDPMVALRTE